MTPQRRGSVYRRGATWTAHVKYQVGGTWKQTKRGGFATRAKAEQELTVLLRSIDVGTVVAPDQLTVETYLGQWSDHLELVVGRRPSTIRDYRNKVRLYATPAFGTVPLQRLTAGHLDDLYRQMARKGLKARTIRYMHTILRKALADAERGGLVEHNVALRANPPTTKATRAPRFAIWSPAELGRFLAHIAGAEHEHALRFAAFTGARRGEICALRWADVDVAAGTATIARSVVQIDGAFHEGDPKSHRTRYVALDPGLVGSLLEHRLAQDRWRQLMGAGWRDNDLVFPSPDGTFLRPDTLTHAFARHVRDAGVPKIRLHDLRHSHATHLIDDGNDAALVSDRLGHATTQFTLDVYVKPSMTRQAEAAARYARLVNGWAETSATTPLPSGAPAA
jgi:integrase